MSKFSQKMLITSLLLSCTLNLGVRPPLAHASLEQTLAPYSDNTMGLITLDLDLSKWNFVIQKLAQLTRSESADAEIETDPKQKNSELMDLIAFLHKDMQFDPLRDGLANLGSHLTLAYQPYANTEGQLLFSLNLKSPTCAKDLIQRLNASLAKREKAIQLSDVNFGGTQILSYQNVFQEGMKNNKSQIHLAVSGSNLIGTLGESSDLLKQMIYRQQVSPANSHYMLKNQDGFQAVQSHVQDQSLWGFVNWQSIFSLIDQNLSTSNAAPLGDKELQILREFVNLGSSIGLGLDIKPDGLHFKSFSAPDVKKLTPEQLAYFQSLSDKNIPTLNEIIEHMPGNPIIADIGQLPQGEAANQLFNQNVFKMLQDETGITESKLADSIKAILNLDYKQELLPALDGRVGFGLFESGKRLDMVLYLGVKKGQENAFDQVMQKKFRFRADQLEHLDKLFEKPIDSSSAIKANMHTLQTIAETYAVDWGGEYPKNVDELIKESQARDYYKELVNPVNQLVGKNLAIADFKDFKADSAQAGQVFWELKKDWKYVIYGYAPDGKLYSISNDDYSLKTVREDLPKVDVITEPTPDAETVDGPNTIIPIELENWKGTPIYHFPLEASLEELFKSFESTKPVIESNDPPQVSALKANMYTYQTMLEIYAIDWGGVYPKDANSLFEEASSKDYWKDITNPVSDLTGQSHAWSDYKDFKADAGLAGTVFYEALDYADDKDYETSGHTNYQIYGYGPDGHLYRMSPLASLESIREDLPVAKSTPEQAPQMEPANEPKEEINPFKDFKLVYARKGNIWMFAWNVDSLKAAIDGNSPPDLQAQIKQHQAQAANGLLYIDPQAGLKLLKEFLPDIDSSNELKEIFDAVKPWKNLYSDTRHASDGSESNVWINIDLDALDLKATSGHLNEVLSNFTTAQDRAKKSSVKANMHTLQTMIETYAVDWGGVYPTDIASLLAEAEKMDYLKEFKNPYDYSSKTIADYSQYQTGPAAAGMVFYQPIETAYPYDEDVSKGIYEYKIYGADGEGQLIQDKGKVFYLTNS